MICPKCEATGGGDWSQCGEACPMEGSPHYVGLRELVFSGLYHAKENGQVEFITGTAEEIASDMLAFDPALEWVKSTDMLIPHVEAWLAGEKKTDADKL